MRCRPIPRLPHRRTDAGSAHGITPSGALRWPDAAESFLAIGGGIAGARAGAQGRRQSTFRKRAPVPASPRSVTSSRAPGSSPRPPRHNTPRIPTPRARSSRRHCLDRAGSTSGRPGSRGRPHNRRHARLDRNPGRSTPHRATQRRCRPECRSAGRRRPAAASPADREDDLVLDPRRLDPALHDLDLRERRPGKSKRAGILKRMHNETWRARRGVGREQPPIGTPDA